MSLGKTIAEARKGLQLSQKELAFLIKKEDGEPISPQYLNDIEQDRRSPSSDHLIEQFASRLKLDREVLYYWVRKLPEDATSNGASQQGIVKAYKAFRKELRKEDR